MQCIEDSAVSVGPRALAYGPGSVGLHAGTGFNVSNVCNINNTRDSEWLITLSCIIVLTYLLSPIYRLCAVFLYVPYSFFIVYDYMYMIFIVACSVLCVTRGPRPISSHTAMQCSLCGVCSACTVFFSGWVYAPRHVSLGP